MHHATFDVSDVFAKGWEKTKKHLWFLLAFELIEVIIQMLLCHMPIVSWLVQTLILVSLSTVILAIVNDKTPSLSDITRNFTTYKKPLSMIAVALVVSALTTLGLLAFVIPGIYIGMRFMFFPFYVIEHEHKDVGQAIGEVFTITKGNSWKLFCFLIIAGFINILGLLAVYIGLLFTIPTTLIAAGYAYKALTPHVKRY